MRWTPAARAPRRWAPRPSVVKGGHLDRAEIVDVLVDGDREVEIVGERVPGVHTHGTGCTFAVGDRRPARARRRAEAAVRAAQAYVREAMRAGVPLGARPPPAGPSMEGAWRPVY